MTPKIESVRKTRAPIEGADGLDRHLCVSQCIADGLVFNDGHAAAAVFGPGEMKREFECRPHEACREYADDGNRSGKTAFGEFLSAAEGANQISASVRTPPSRKTGTK